MSDEIEHKISLPGEWALKKTLGPTLDAIGVDLEKLYVSSKKGVEKIALAAKSKIPPSDGQKEANLRVTRDVFWNGAFADDDICAEYFGGVLASSRSSHGKDDSGVFYLDIIKSLSSSQLRLHYLIYSSLNKLLVRSKRDINVGYEQQLAGCEIFMLYEELKEEGIKIETDFDALLSKGLIKSFNYGYPIEENSNIYIVDIAPLTLGIQLFAIASNCSEEWRKFDSKIFNRFAVIQKLTHYSFRASDLLTQSN